MKPPSLPLLAALGLSAPAAAAELEWRAMVGGQVDPAPHGVFDLALRTDDWELGLYTDTLQALWTPSGDRGRSWLGTRNEALIAGLTIDPWLDGALARELGWTTSYLGLEAGTVRYGPKGLYAGLQGNGRRYLLGEGLLVAQPDPVLTATADKLDKSDVFIVRAEAVGGWWSPAAHAWLIAGLDWVPDAVDPVVHGQKVQPHLNLTATWRPEEGLLVPRAELRAALASGQGGLTATRVGGLNPYVVPVAGAGWGELWAESYVALRAGPEVHKGPVRVGLLGDLALVQDDVWRDLREELWLLQQDPAVFASYDGDRPLAGASLQARYQPARFYVEGALGRGFLERAPGVSPYAGWVLLGLDWGGRGEAGSS